MSASNCNCLGMQEFSQPVNIICKRAKGPYKSTRKKKKKKEMQNCKHSINER